MRFEIDHSTVYEYDGGVFLEPFVVRLRPRSDSWQRVESYDLHVDPPPGGASELLDAEGSEATMLWFDGVQRRLEVRSRAVVVTLRPNPFDYIVPASSSGAALPLRYAAPVDAVLAPCLRGPDPAVAALAARVAGSSSGVVDFLNRLADELYSSTAVIVREEGEPHPPGETLREGEGSCRDLAVVYMHACRSVGVAARFVSGYQAGDPDAGERYLHAWCEAFVPGGGWRGYDPTHGLAVADEHVALAASCDPLLAAPTSGTFRGRARATMRVALHIATSG